MSVTVKTAKMNSMSLTCVYKFAFLLLETISRRRPFSSDLSRGEEQVLHSEHKRLTRRMQRSLGFSQDHSIPKEQRVVAGSS
jgi:hypothetical protein